MKFIHIADVHLGMVSDPGRPWSQTWTEDRMSTLQAIINLCNEEQTDLLFIAGDLFDKTPNLAQLKEVDYLFSTLEKTYVVLIAGNHDAIAADSPYRDFQWHKKVIFLKKPTFSSAYFPQFDLEVCGFSYDRTEITEPRYDQVHPGTRGKYHVLLAHGGDAKHVPINHTKLAAAGFDYIAMGHIHQPTSWPEHRMAYSGSLMPADMNDTGQRGYIRGEITDAGTLFAFVPFSPHEYTNLRLNLAPETSQALVEAQLKQLFTSHPGTVYRVILEGYYNPETPPDLNRLRLCGNIIRLEDRSLPAYSLEELAKEHAQDVIGMYLATFDLEHLDEVETKALYHGLSALLKGSQA